MTAGGRRAGPDRGREPPSRGVGSITDGLRRPYRKPRLRSYGGLLDVTLGGSPGVGDSAGNPLTENPLV